MTIERAARANMSALRETALERARALGFHRVGIATLQLEERHDQSYRDWLERGFHGQMDYMERQDHQVARREAERILAGARCAIVVALAYSDSAAPPAEPAHAFIARYARGADYHRVMREKLEALGQSLQALEPALRYRACVDTAPVLERALAERAGLGFIGKNTMLISPGLGSYTLLGELFLDIELEPTTPTELTSRCGSCTACLDACPTGAITDPFVVDARRCISYLTIEQRDEIPGEHARVLENMVFGCDRCQEVCPYNAKAPSRHAPAPELLPAKSDPPKLLELARLGSNTHKRFVAGTALTRVSRPRLLRNVAAALGNLEGDEARAALEKLTGDSNAMVASAAREALERRENP